MKAPLPFSVFKRANRPCYLVAFKNEKTGAYLPPISTRQTTEAAAIKTAYEWFLRGVPQKEKGCSNLAKTWNREHQRE